MRMKYNFIENFLWAHYGDQYDSFHTWKFNTCYWFTTRKCYFFGHVWYEDGPNQWRSEYKTICLRCCDDRDNTYFYRMNPCPPGDQLKQYIKWKIYQIQCLIKGSNDNKSDI